MAVGQIIDKQYMPTSPIYTVSWDKFDFDNSRSMYLYILSNAFWFKATQRYHIFADRNCWFYLGGWNGSWWTTIYESPLIEESETIEIGINAGSVGGTYSHSSSQPYYLYRLRHQPYNRSYMDMTLYCYGATGSYFDSQFKGKLIRMRPGSLIIESWTTYDAYTPSNNSSLNVAGARGNVLYDSLKERFLFGNY